MTQQIRVFRDDFDGFARRFRDRAALIEGRTEENFTYGEVADLVQRYRQLFENAGVQPGGTIAALIPNSVEMLACFLATIYHGYGFAPLSADSPSPEIERWLSLTAPDFVLCADTLPKTSIDTMRAACRLEQLTVGGNFDFLPRDPGQHDTAPENARLFMSTSGTTGEPKAMVLDSNVLWSSGHAFSAFHGFVDESARFLNILPMSYLGGLFNLGLIPLSHGGSTVIQESFSGRSFFNFWNTVERFEVNVLWLVPSIIRGLLTMAERAKPENIANMGIRACFLGTAPIDLETKQAFEETFGVPALENFALSETTFFTTETLSTRHRRSEGSTGEPLPYVDIGFTPISEDQSEHTAMAGQEIAVKSPFLFQGYLSTDGTIDLPLNSDGYFLTGDVGLLDDRNRLIVHGRVRDIIKKGGYFVPLSAVERLAQSHEDIYQAAAVTVSHAFFGESFELYVHPSKDVEDEWVANVFAPWLHANLAKHMWPEKIILTGEFPQTSSGKIRKHLLSAPEESNGT